MLQGKFGDNFPVNNKVMSKYATNKSEFCWRISLANLNKFFTLYSLNVISFRIGRRNIAVSSWVFNWLKDFGE